MHSPGFQYRLYYPRYISGYEKVKMYTTNQTNTMETEPLTKGIVIFGATGDLCKKKLIPALYKLWQKELLSENFLIMGSARREPTAEQWKESLGDYPEEFLWHLDYQMADLSMVDTLRHLPDYIDDITYFLSVPPNAMRMLSSISKKQDVSTTQTTRVLLLKNPLGTIINLLIIYSLWLSDIYARNRFIALTIILAKILLITYLLLGLAIFCWNHFGIVST